MLSDCFEYILLLWDFLTLGSPSGASEGFWNAGNNPMVGMTVSVAVAVEESLKK